MHTTKQRLMPTLNAAQHKKRKASNKHSCAAQFVHNNKLPRARVLSNQALERGARRMKQCDIETAHMHNQESHFLPAHKSTTRRRTSFSKAIALGNTARHLLLGIIDRKETQRNPQSSFKRTQTTTARASQPAIPG